MSTRMFCRHIRLCSEIAIHLRVHENRKMFLCFLRVMNEYKPTFGIQNSFDSFRSYGPGAVTLCNI